MTIPDYQSLMLPLLEAVSSGETYRLRDLLPALADRMGLTPTELEQQVPSGTERLFDNRTWWASTYLVKAGLLARPRRSYICITSDGARVLQDRPARIDNAFLAHFTAARKSGDPGTVLASNDLNLSPDTRTPDEILEATWLDRRKALGQDLLVRLKDSSPAFFERLVVDLLVKMGYGGSIAEAASVVGAPNDEGIDGLIKEDPLGLDVVYVQAKKWGQPVGRPLVQAFAGSLEGQRARKGVMITTSLFTPEAQRYVGQIEKKIVLIDGERLVSLMMDHGVGVATAKSYVVQKIDLDYFEEG